MSSKLSKGASNRLLNLLYTTTSTEIATKVPIVSKYLYQQDETLTNEKPNEKAKGSILDGLMENEWKQKPFLGDGGGGFAQYQRSTKEIKIS